VTDLARREVRAPTAATVTSTWQSPGLAQMPEWNTEYATTFEYYANVVAFSSIRAIAQDLAQLAFRVGPDPSKPDEYSVTDPLARLMGPEPGSPNEEMSTTTFYEFTVSQLLLSGCFAWELDYAKGTNNIAGIWPLMSRYIRPIVSRDPKYYFSGIEYRIGNKAVQFGRDKALYYWRPSQEDVRQLESKLRPLRLAIGVMVMQDRYDYAFLQNDARPASVIVHEAFANRQDRDAWRENFESEHKGPENAGKPHWIEASEDGASPKDAFNVVSLGLSQADAEFIKRYDQKLRDVVMGFGVPMSRLGDTSARTYSNADKEYEIYRKNVIAPVAREIASFINRRLAPRFGSNVGWFDLRPYEVEERNNKIIKANPVELVKARIITINEARGAFALGPTDGGDRFMTDEELGLLQNGAASMLTASRLVLTEKDPTNLEPGEQPQLPEDPAEIAAEKAAADKQALALAQAKPALPAGKPKPPGGGAGGRSVGPSARETRRAARQDTYRTIDATARATEEEFRHAVTELFSRQRKIALSRLNGKRGRQLLAESRSGVDIGGIFDRNFWKDETRGTFMALFRKIFGNTVGRINAKYGLEVPEDLQAGEMYAAQRAARMAQQITDTTYEVIERELRTGAANGEDLVDLEARVNNAFDRTFAGRPEMIARTEVMSAYNGSVQVIARRAAPTLFVSQEWLATPDMKTRDTHVEADGQVQPVGGVFSVGDALLAYPGDPDGPAEETINCRCALDILTADEQTSYDAQDQTHVFDGSPVDVARGGLEPSVQ
jgi:HK97 family phage portal protein